MGFMKNVEWLSDELSYFSKRTFQFLHHRRLSPFRIGVIVPEFYGLTFQFLYGFRTKLEDLNVFFTTRLCTAIKRDFEENRRSIESFLAGDEYDVIISHGIFCTQVAYSITYRYEKPLIFAGVQHYKALELRLIDSLEYSGNHTTGVLLDRFPFEKQFSELAKLGVFFENVLVVYNSDKHILDFLVEEVRQVCVARKLSLETFEINMYENYEKYLGPYLDRSNLVLIVRDSFTTIEVATIARLCKKYNTMLCTSDWSSVCQGAPMAFGFDERLIGDEVAQKAFFVLEKKMHPSMIPLSSLPYSYSLCLPGSNNNFLKK